MNDAMLFKPSVRGAAMLLLIHVVAGPVLLGVVATLIVISNGVVAAGGALLAVGLLIPFAFAPNVSLRWKAANVMAATVAYTVPAFLLSRGIFMDVPVAVGIVCLGGAAMLFRFVFGEQRTVVACWWFTGALLGGILFTVLWWFRFGGAHSMHFLMIEGAPLKSTSNLVGILLNRAKSSGALVSVVVAFVIGTILEFRKSRTVLPTHTTHP